MVRKCIAIVVLCRGLVSQLDERLNSSSQHQHQRTSTVALLMGRSRTTRADAEQHLQNPATENRTISALGLLASCRSEEVGHSTRNSRSAQ
jgi:hypothetical protein